MEVRDFPGRTVVVRLDGDLDAALDALEVLQRDLFEVLVVQVDAESGCAVLVEEALGSAVQSDAYYVDAVRHVVPRLDREALGRLVPPDWSSLIVSAVVIRCPGTRLALESGGSVYELPVGPRGVAGPPEGRRVLQPPLWVRLLRDEGEVELHLALFWSGWADEGTEGRAAIDQRLADLAGRRPRTLP